MLFPETRRSSSIPENDPQMRASLSGSRRQYLFAMLASGLGASSASLSTDASAQTYPSKPIMLVAPFAPGGFTSSAARILADRMSEYLGQAVVVENRPGAGGMVAADYVARAKADGYTLLFGSRVTQVTNPLVNRTKLPSRQDFAPIATLCDVSGVVVAARDRPYTSIAELVAYAKANPLKVNYATPGQGTASHLAAAVFMQLTGTQLTHVPYKGSAAALQDLLGGRMDIAFDYPSTTAPFIRSGQLSGLATLGTQRVPMIAHVPTIAEAGAPGAEMASWQAVLAPGQTPPAVLEKLQNAMRQASQEPDTAKKLIDLGTTPLFVAGDALQQLIEQEIAKWRSVVESARIYTS